MKEMLRKFLLIPVCVVALVAVTSIFLSLTTSAAVLGQTTPPQPPGTIPSEPDPTETPANPPGNTPTRQPAPPAATATPTPVSISDGRVRANGWILAKVVGNRLSETIYGVAVAPRLYRSDDNGRTWAFVKRNPAITDFLVSPADPGVLYSTFPIECESNAQTPLYRSDNSGVSWHELAPGFNVLPLIADPTDSDVVIGTSCDGLYRSEDGGWTWSILSTSANSDFWTEFDPVEIDAAYFADGDTAQLTHLYALVRNEESSLVLYSGDSGATWSEVTPMGEPLQFHALAVDPYVLGRLWLTEENGIWTTEDQGQFWGFSSSGLDGGIENGLSDIVQHPDDLLFVGSGMGLYTKPVDETMWTLAGNRTLQRQEIVALLLTESAASQVWINAANGVYRYFLE